MRTKVFAVMAVFALAFAGVLVIPGADAEQMDVAIDTDKGAMTLTVDQILALDDIEAIGVDDVTYRIALATDITLDFSNMSAYEVVKPFIKNGYVVLTAEDIAGVEDKDDLVDAICMFLENDAEQPNYVAYADGEWSGAVQTILVMDTPANYVAQIEALTGEFEATVADKDAVIAELEAAIAADDSAQTIADLTATNTEQATKIADLESRIADLEKENKALDQPEEKLWETGVGKCLIIIVAFLVAMVLWHLYTTGKFDKVLKKKTKAPKEEKEA